MFRKMLVAAGAVGLVLAATPAQAATTTTTCSNYGLQSGLYTKVCAEITDGQVELYGQISLAGPPSPGYPIPTHNLLTTLSGNVVGGASLGTTQQNVTFRATTTQVRGVSGTVACGSTVHATFAVAEFGWYNTPVSLDVPVNC
ncbi:hypothetical protein ACIRBX_11585 [Kitasatospora sp. NPDC096147]|uniref:hypothetical protein n=1 Tax=Kitasatospora sp. NPDC096147 TaxID=3364093 RepID=UPI0038305931